MHLNERTNMVSKYLFGTDEADALEPGLEEGLAADGAEAAAGQQLAQLGVVLQLLTQLRPPAHNTTQHNQQSTTHSIVGVV